MLTGSIGGRGEFGASRPPASSSRSRTTSSWTPQEAYIKALKPAGENDDDIVGFVFAVNGKLNSADAYPSNGLFRKMWPKLLDASAIEAISHKDDPRVGAPSMDPVTAFLAAPEAGKSSEKPLNAGVATRHPRRRPGLSTSRPPARPPSPRFARLGAPELPGEAIPVTSCPGRGAARSGAPLIRAPT